MEDRIDFYHKAIERLATGLTSDDGEGRQRVYERVRGANEKFIGENDGRLSQERIDDMRRQLERAIDAYEMEASMSSGPQDAVLPGEEGIGHLAGEPAPLPETPVAGKPAGFRRGLDLGAAGGFVAAVVLALLLSYFGLWPFAGGGGEQRVRSATFEAGYQQSLPVVEAQLALLRRIEKAVQDRQKADPEGLQKAAGSGVISLGKVFPDLFREAKEIGDNRLRIYLRATGDAYKILFITPLCTAARIAQPGVADPRRAKDRFFCDYYGAWNQKGAKF